MPITAFSNKHQRELDLPQWLALNHGAIEPGADVAAIPAPLRAKAVDDIECSCCAARGVRLVQGRRSKSTAKPVGQAHFRFQTADDNSAHRPLCDFYDEGKVRGQEYLVDLASDKTPLTRAVRDLVCRGLAAGLFTQADMRGMRLWFLKEKEAHSRPLDVSEELLRWVVDMASLRTPWPPRLDFAPEHGALPGFDWKQAAEVAWARDNKPLFGEAGDGIYFWRDTSKRALKLLAQYANETVLDPTVLRDKYEATESLARFVASHLPHPARPPALVSQHSSGWGSFGNAFLALSALLLHVSDWNLQRASSLYCRLLTVQAVPSGLEGNLVGLNPFHDYAAWKLIAGARRVGVRRTDVRPVADQVAQLQAEMRAQHAAWAAREGIAPSPATGPLF
jgi:hypothetical protein